MPSSSPERAPARALTGSEEARGGRGDMATGGRPIVRRPLPLAALALAGLIAGLALLMLTPTGERATNRGAYSFAAIVLAIGWGFIGTGLLAWWRRPENRTGALMVAVGFAWFLASLGGLEAPLLHTLGLLCGTLWGAPVYYTHMTLPTIA